MSETINDIDKEVAEGTEQPFAFQFLEVIGEQAGEEAISGQYNPTLQVWENGDGPMSLQFPVASFPGGERPPTTCTVPTRLSPTVVRTDNGVDD